MKKLKVLVLLGVVALSLAACKKEEPANEPETKQEAVKDERGAETGRAGFGGRDSGESEPFDRNPGFVRCGDRKTTGSRYGE